MADARSKGLYVRPITPRIIRKSATVRVNYSLTITLSMVLNKVVLKTDNLVTIN